MLVVYIGERIDGGDDLISDLPLRVFDNAVLIGVKRLLVDVAKKSMVTNR